MEKHFLPSLTVVDILKRFIIMRKKKFSCVRCGKVCARSAHYSNHISKCGKHVAVEAMSNSNHNDENDVEFSKDGESEEAFEVID